jgi:hypothetical protein
MSGFPEGVEEIVSFRWLAAAWVIAFCAVTGLAVTNYPRNGLQHQVIATQNSSGPDQDASR